MSDSPLSSPISNDDFQQISNWMTQAGAGFAVYGVQATFSAVTTYYNLGQDWYKSKEKVFRTLSTGGMLLSSTIITILQSETNLNVAQLTVNDVAAKVLHVRVEDIEIARSFLQKINSLASQVAGVWRSSTVYPDNPALKLVLSLCMTASGVTSLVDAGIDAAKTRSQPDDTSTASTIKSAGLALARRATLGQDNGSPNGLMFTVPLLVTNVVSTSVYGYKAWQQQEAIRKTTGEGKHSIGLKERASLLLLESGALYGIFWTVYTFMSIFGNTQSSGFQAFAATMPVISALNPTLVILMVTMQERHKDRPLTLSQTIKIAESMDLDPEDSDLDGPGEKTDLESQNHPPNPWPNGVPTFKNEEETSSVKSSDSSSTFSGCPECGEHFHD
ncbi:hypothetical protein VKT23_014147 [Stygiomarasmius scandens]|uniref:Uncharacterized protein n=1 Tax=Marasmiellus scandens TaxID=2682957 RepID=A0ABR1J1N5_9AGAR